MTAEAARALCTHRHIVALSNPTPKEWKPVHPKLRIRASNILLGLKRLPDSILLEVHTPLGSLGA